MATVTYIPERKQSTSALKGLINYCLQDSKVHDKITDRRLVSGVNCNGENAFAEFMSTKNSYGKRDGICFYQYVQSFSPKENITPEKAHRIGVQFAEKAWQGYEVLVTTHSDAGHIHSHFVINSVSFENGYKLRQDTKTLIRLRALSDEICKKNGLQTLTAYKGGGTKVSNREYRAAIRGESWKFRLMSCIDRAMNVSGSIEEFTARMKGFGYQMTWTNERKYITFICPDGKKCRDKTLHNDKYLKENIEYELQFREQHYKRRKRYAGNTDEEERGRTVRFTDRYNAGNGTYSGKGLGYNGESSSGGSRFSAAGVRGFRTARDLSAAGGNGENNISGAGKELRERGEGTAGEAQVSADGSGKSAPSDEGCTATGWEESRKNYERFLGAGQGIGEGNKQGNSKKEPSHMDNPPGNIRSSVGVSGVAVSSALRSFAGIIQSDEDEEERRKRIEAEQNGDTIGAVIGLAVGLLTSVAQGDSEELPDELKDEQSEIKLKM